MKPTRWSSEKSLLLKTERGVSDEELLASFDRGEWESVRNKKGEIARVKAAAEATLLKNKRVNIRLSSLDLERLQGRAA